MGAITFTVEGHPGFAFMVHSVHDNWIKAFCTEDDDCIVALAITFAEDFDYTSEDIARVWEAIGHTHA